MKRKIKGIYTITNLVNNKIYVGSSTRCIYKRVKDHIYALKNNKHHSIHLQRAYNKYGNDNFQFEILEECEDKYCLSQEQYWINILNVCSRKFGYNICTVAGNTKGIRPSKETKEKIGRAHIGRKSPNMKSFSRVTKVKQIDYNGKIIKEHSNIREVSETMKIDQESIIRCCKGQYKTSGGYQWEFVDTELKNKYKKKIEQFNNIEYKKITYKNKYKIIVPEFELSKLFSI